MANAATKTGSPGASGFAWTLVALAALVAVADALGLFGAKVPAILADRDFANYWIAARLAVSGGTADLFSTHDVYFAHLQAAFGADYPWRAWSYPPHYVLFVWPLGFLGYVPAMIVFLAITLAAYLLAARVFLHRLDRQTLLLLLPLILFNVIAAQNGFLSGALMLGALALRYDRPVIAGILAGCLTIKPQLGVMLPILFLIEGRWTTIVSAGVTTIALILVSIIAFGVESWIGYVEQTFRYQSDVMNHATGVFLHMIPSVFGSLRSLGYDASTAMAAHLLVAIPALAVATFAMSRSKEPAVRAAIAITATFVVTPYALAYDLGAFAAALAIMARTKIGRTLGALITAAAVLPLFMVQIGMASLPVAPLILGAVLCYAVGRGACSRAVYGMSLVSQHGDLRSGT